MGWDWVWIGSCGLQNGRFVGVAVRGCSDESCLCGAEMGVGWDGRTLMTKSGGLIAELMQVRRVGAFTE